MAGEYWHFIGIGGAGMAPLAEIAMSRGVVVSGSDLIVNDKIKNLQTAGATIAPPGHHRNHVPENTTLVIYSSAVSSDNPEMLRAQELSIPCCRRGELLGRLGKLYRQSIAISGAHGKTTISAMLSWILRKEFPSCGYLVGGALSNGAGSAAAGNGDLFITEVDESDGTHVAFVPTLAVVSNVDDDHAWSVGGVENLHNNFRKFASAAGKLLYWQGETAERVLAGIPAIQLSENSFQEFFSQELPFRGYQKIDAMLAIRAAAEVGVAPAKALEALTDFPGVERRMTIRGENKDLVLIEDYAHHPAELKLSLSFLREKYPNRHLRVLFQPHRYARLERYFPEFVEILSNDCDSCLIAPVFAAWSETGKVNSSDLTRAIGNHAVEVTSNWADTAEKALAFPQRPAVIAVIGAGDVEQVLPCLQKLL